jgi:hypothetical protein
MPIRPVTGTAGKLRRNLGFRAWWAKPATEFVPCDCGWRPDLGVRYRVERPGSFAARLGRRRGMSAA